jgi:hypothetical protein
MPVCAGIKRAGGRCTVSVSGAQQFCHLHDPARSEERKRAASKAARSRPSREIVGVKAQLADLTQDVLAGELETGRAAVANQLINTRLRAIELERKIKEAEELEERIEALERAQEGGRRWGT